MNNIKYIIFFIVCFITVCRCNRKQEDKTFLRKERSSLWGLKERLINGLSRMCKYDVKGWVNVEKLSNDALKKIDLRLQGGKVICMNSNNVVPVKALSYKIKHEDNKNVYSEYVFEYIGVNNKKKMLNPIPVMIPKEPGTRVIKTNKVLPDNFKGYLVCEEKGSPAILIQHTIETLEFMTPPWRTLVDIELYKNPLAPYGRLYKINVLDNVEVLKNGKKSFFWPIPISSMAEVYAFQTAIDDSRKGKYCMLSRDAGRFTIKLSCRSWERSVTNEVVNGFMFLGLLIMNSCMGANLFFLKHPPLYTKTIPLANGNTTVLYSKEEILRLTEEEGEEEEEKSNVKVDETSNTNKQSVVGSQMEDEDEEDNTEMAVNTNGSNPTESDLFDDTVNQLESDGTKGVTQTNVGTEIRTVKDDKNCKRDKKEKEKSKGELALEKFDKYYPYKEDDKKKMKKMLFYGNLVYLIGWGLLNGGWGIISLVKIGLVLRRANDELKKAKLINIWRLEYPNTKVVKMKTVTTH